MNRQLKPFPITTEDQAQQEWPSHADMQIDPQNPGTHTPVGNTQSKKRQPLLIALCIIIVIIVVAASGAIYWLHKHQAKTASQSRTATNQPSLQTTPTVNTTQAYTSNGKDLNLNFTYPADWTVTPASGNNASDQTITLNSPLTSVTDINNATVTGKVVVMIRPGSADLNEFSSGNATAGQTSAQFAYSKPTAAQHQYPYLTFVHLPGGTNPNSGFEEVVITGITQFAKDQPVTADSLSALDPIISASFYKCSTQTCTAAGATPLSITNTMWQNTAVFQQVQALFQSLQLN